MKQIALLSSIFGKGKGQNRKLFTYGIFVCIAILMWYANNLSKTYSTELWIPVVYQNPPEGKMVSRDPGSRLLVGVRASGYSVFKTYLHAQWDPVMINLRDFPLRPASGLSGNRYFFLSYALLSHMNNALGTGVIVERIRPDSLIFHLSDKITVKLPVTPNLKMEFEQQYMQKGQARIVPDSIYVAGPAAIVDTMRTIHTVSLIRKKLSDSLSETIPISMHPLLSYSSTVVLVRVPVERFTETVVSVPVQVRNVPEAYVVRTFPSHISVHCKVGVSDYEKLNDSLFTATLDFNALQTYAGSNARVTLTEFPRWISDISITPANIEFLIER